MAKKRGFVLVIVLSFLAVLFLVAWIVVNLGCGEILQTRTANDLTSAYYVAMSGAELSYLSLMSIGTQNLTLAQWLQPISGSVTIPAAGGGTATVGTFTATPHEFDSSHIAIVCEGNVNGHRTRAVAKYRYARQVQGGIPLGCMGPMELYGKKGLLGLKSWVRAQGPLETGSTLTKNAYATITSGYLENQSFTPLSFWQGYNFNPSTNQWELYEKAHSSSGMPKFGDTNGDGSYITDTNGDGEVTTADFGVTDANGDGIVNESDIDIGDSERTTKIANLAIFNADDQHPHVLDRNPTPAQPYYGKIDDGDAFYFYYTTELMKVHPDLGINRGGPNHYAGQESWDFSPGSVPQHTPMIFVDGDANIAFNDTNWWGYGCNHTLVSTSDVTIVQPTNGSDDVLTLIAYGDVITGGIRAFGGIKGDLVVYSKGDFIALYGGRTDGTIFTEGNVYVDTVWAIPGLLNRDLNKGSIDFSDPANWPLGLPPGYEDNVVLYNFDILEDPANPVVWQKD